MDLYCREKNNGYWFIKNIVITDCRFPNEIDLLRKLGGQIIHIHKKLPIWYNNYKNGNFCNEAELLHPSERLWIHQHFDHVIDNRGSITELNDAIQKYIQDTLQI